MSHDGRPEGQSCWLTIGKIYDVLEVTFDGEWLLRLIGDAPNGVALFQLKMFEVVDPHIPPNWIAIWGNNGLFFLSPRPWTHTGFWERYYDRDPNAVQIFEEERTRTVNPT
jgi:hypothetical protein